MCDLEFVGGGVVARHQQPARQLLLDAMKVMADHRLCDLCDQRVQITGEGFLPLLVPPAKHTQAGGPDSQRLAGDLYAGA